LQDFVKADVKETLNLVHIIVQHRHRLPHSVVLEKLNLTRLQVIIGVCTQLMLYTLGKIHESVLISPLEKTFEEKNYYTQHCQEYRQPPGVYSSE